MISYTNINSTNSDYEKCFIKNVKFAMMLTFRRDYTCSTNMNVKM